MEDLPVHTVHCSYSDAPFEHVTDHGNAFHVRETIASNCNKYQTFTWLGGQGNFTYTTMTAVSFETGQSTHPCTPTLVYRYTADEKPMSNHGSTARDRSYTHEQYSDHTDSADDTSGPTCCITRTRATKETALEKSIDTGARKVCCLHLTSIHSQVHVPIHSL